MVNGELIWLVVEPPLWKIWKSVGIIAHNQRVYSIYIYIISEKSQKRCFVFPIVKAYKMHLMCHVKLRLSAVCRPPTLTVPPNVGVAGEIFVEFRDLLRNQGSLAWMVDRKNFNKTTFFLLLAMIEISKEWFHLKHIIWLTTVSGFHSFDISLYHILYVQVIINQCQPWGILGVWQSLTTFAGLLQDTASVVIGLEGDSEYRTTIFWYILLGQPNKEAQEKISAYHLVI